MDVSEVICNLNQNKKNLGYWVMQEIKIEFGGKNLHSFNNAIYERLSKKDWVI